MSTHTIAAATSPPRRDRAEHGQVHVVGVRHHSPACARLVEATIREVHPRYVLIEGPSDFNARITELMLGHELPVALFSFLRADNAMTRGSWYPLCSYSPEYVAMQTGADIDAEVRFMDLPSWHDAFAETQNHSADRVDRYGEAIDALCARTGASGHDALWDHLFEGQTDLASLAEALDMYFQEIRSLSPVGARDQAREDHMRAYVQAAARSGAPTVVVCGGFHAPTLAEEVHRNTAVSTPIWPETPAPPLGTAENYLVPYSYARLDAFAGYQSGMPSPGYYEALASSGPDGAADELLRRTADALRKAGIGVSTADLVATRVQADGLARLRGHPQPLRVDLLDGLASALLKEAHDQPFPWDQRALLDPRTHPMLASIVQTFTGSRKGRLAPSTPLPPLVADVAAELLRTGLRPVAGLPTVADPRRVDLDLTVPRDRDRSSVLHRLRVLAIPGFVNPASALAVRERWTVHEALDADVALIESSIHGPTLETAAAGRLRSAIDAAALDASSSDVGRVLVETVLCGLRMLDSAVLSAARQVIGNDQRIGRVAAMLDTLSIVASAVDVLDAGSLHADFRQQVADLVSPCLQRFLWLLEQVVGPTGPDDGAVIHGLVALTRAASRSSVDPAMLSGVLERKSQELATPPAVRGACLGTLWTLDLLGDDAMERSVAALRSLPPDQQPGDLLGGLFATARRAATTDDRLITAIDQLVDAWTPEQFLTLLPGLRAAFAWFPPRERSTIARRIAALRGLAPGTRLVGLLAADPLLVAEGAVLDERITAYLQRYGLEPRGSEHPGP